jgi:hypothetical protein
LDFELNRHCPTVSKRFESSQSELYESMAHILR